MMTKFIAFHVLSISMVFFATTTMAQNLPQIVTDRVWLTIGKVEIDAEVARSKAEQATGLMHRTTLGNQEGMLFVFDKKSKRCFWMKDTSLSLSLAFIDEDGTIVNIQDMEPYSTKVHCSATSVKFALEVNKGWFQKNGIDAGARFSLPKSLLSDTSFLNSTEY